MSQYQRVDKVVELLTEGKTYLVPTVRGEFYEARRHGDQIAGVWPVIGRRHHDIEFFNVEMSHYHIDLRFVDMKYIRQGTNVLVGETNGNAIKYVPMVCRQSCVSMSFHNQPGNAEFQQHFSGTQCKGSRKTGWICPHRGAFLGSVYVGLDGVMTCPLHGLKIIGMTGKVV